MKKDSAFSMSAESLFSSRKRYLLCRCFDESHRFLGSYHITMMPLSQAISADSANLSSSERGRPNAGREHGHSRKVNLPVTRLIKFIYPISHCSLPGDLPFPE